MLYKQDNDVLPVLKIDGDTKKIFLDLLLGLNMEVGEQDIDPVPLTPEWLERCGFTGLDYGIWDGPRIEINDTIEIFTIESRKDGYYLKGSEWIMGKPFLHIHQLQNLYFALTGEELKINLP